ncbi:thiamine pyrophosphate protein domain-containing protein [Brachyspira pilosicoli WesB]|uniref:Thiamine pyrophosphate protein domain-containing protein n=1 Tax=Brachyspira pilosicoli WesB TaxID=1161918 RepID=K0JF48_BRAPL|nr:thiamine pyrophosphate-dependent enzyme [Brachyspira pilosicoli]CCG55828.1 thiamine pyrophosphate protein domain-containing protein [Brachyspira pilosicoli WesB]
MIVFEKSKGLTDSRTHYCPGCMHGVSQRIIAECLEELGVLDRSVGIASVGCSVLAYKYFSCDMQQAAHGRAPAVATGVKRAIPDSVVFTLQGDGDLAAIGTAEIVHAAARGENITVIFLNNAIYGMTGGQMAPTTLEGQKTTTTQAGRDFYRAGKPIRVCEMLATIEGATFVERVALDTPANIRKAKMATKKAFENQIAGKGFSIVEMLTSCTTNWGISPTESHKWIREYLIPHYPLGNFRNDG